jgi:hypothetical protein
MDIPTKEINVSYNALDKESLESVIFELQKVKSFIFKNTLAQINYLKVYKETGEKPPFYDEVMQLKNIIEYLDYWKGRAEKRDILNN